MPSNERFALERASRLQAVKCFWSKLTETRLQLNKVSGNHAEQGIWRGNSFTPKKTKKRRPRKLVLYSRGKPPSSSPKMCGGFGRDTSKGYIPLWIKTQSECFRCSLFGHHEFVQNTTMHGSQPSLLLISQFVYSPFSTMWHVMFDFEYYFAGNNYNCLFRWFGGCGLTFGLTCYVRPDKYRLNLFLGRRELQVPW